MFSIYMLPSVWCGPDPDVSVQCVVAQKSAGVGAEAMTAAPPITAAARFIVVAAHIVLVSPAHWLITQVCQLRAPDRLEVADSVTDRQPRRGPPARWTPCKS